MRCSRFSILILLAFLGSCAQTLPTAPPSAAQLLGTWKVDLRPTPAAEAYYQEFVVTSVKGKSFEGTFYGSALTQGRINTDWGTVRIAFVTADGSGPYNHSAVLAGSTLQGLTNSTGRDFLSYWSAEKK
ncbi:MAG: hypothetical protein CFE44_00260 [Burkholderiales bacterium PBB4]|nr:MAG: hypothetical protein CFE44_00260 [Burkholderiales bacterium PBB4]